MKSFIVYVSSLVLILLPTIGCGNSTSATSTPEISQTESTQIRELKILAHDSFDISDDVIQEFEDANNAKITIFKAGDAGEMINRAILEKGNPSTDLLYGIDNTYLTRALKEEVFQPYVSPMISNIPNHLILDNTSHVTPVDYAYVNINYDKDYLKNNQLDVPTSLEELTQPQWKGKLVVENPATSSPGLAFLIVTVSYFGEDDDYNYLDFWKSLRMNDVLVKDGWSDAYYTDFTMYGGDRPLVVSYATSPAAEVFFSDGKYVDPPTGNILIDHATFLQIEGIGILNGTSVDDLAEKFIDYTLTKRFQEDIPSRMFVYPVNPEASTPDFFKFAQVPTLPAVVTHTTIDEKRDEWIDAWTKIVLR